jgi:hypothetical protein
VLHLEMPEVLEIPTGETMVTKLKPAEGLTSIADFANAWGVTEKTVSNWVEFTYQAFEVLLPSNGDFPDWGIQLLTLCAKHVSEKSSLYFAETGERRRLKGSEFVKKIRTLREEGHFAEFQKFQKFRNPSTSIDPADALEDEALAELGAITRRSDSELSRIKGAIEQHEDAEVEELAAFIEGRDQRKMSKLVRRLQTGKPASACVGAAIDVAYRQLPSA